MLSSNAAMSMSSEVGIGERCLALSTLLSAVLHILCVCGYSTDLIYNYVQCTYCTWSLFPHCTLQFVFAVLSFIMFILIIFLPIIFVLGCSQWQQPCVAIVQDSRKSDRGNACTQHKCSTQHARASEGTSHDLTRHSQISTTSHGAPPSSPPVQML